MRTGVASGHPATAEAGAEILADGGSAADAAVAPPAPRRVAETVMTGFLGGAHAIYRDARSGGIENLDCFVAIPRARRTAEDARARRATGALRNRARHYAVGPASCGVPGVPAGLDALWSRFGRLPWPRLCEPALTLARTA